MGVAYTAPYSQYTHRNKDKSKEHKQIFHFFNPLPIICQKFSSQIMIDKVVREKSHLPLLQKKVINKRKRKKKERKRKRERSKLKKPKHKKGWECSLFQDLCYKGKNVNHIFSGFFVCVFCSYSQKDNNVRRIFP